MTEPVINPDALEPLFGPSDIPNRHRIKSTTHGAPARVVNGRRPSPLKVVKGLRRLVNDWREAQYGGASETTRELLAHWFGGTHLLSSPDGTTYPFNYYFCQREAVETLIYLYEVRGIRSLSALVAETSGDEREALGVSPAEDLWARYAFKIATGAGKTKVMSLAVVWSYFHALREADSPLAQHFLVIAPGITVFERLKDDFADGRIFNRDPLIPVHWRGDWNLSVILQDQVGGAATGASLYLTNIHRLYDRRTSAPGEETYGWMGPPVSKAKALDTGAALRDRITKHPRLMVLNDEAHHVWDPGSAWSEAISYLHDTCQKRGGGLVAQLDLSATPKDDKGNVFRHVVCDTPLGEAVDAGIVKTPIIGHGDKLTERSHDDASYRYENHLTLGYRRWLASQEEWEKVGKKPLLFVMTEDTKAADQIASRLNSDTTFRELNGKTINLHTNLKGKLKLRGKGASAYYEFVESEKDISDEDLNSLRKLSRELDNSTSPYRCIVSVLMLREGWDVRNVTTIVPLRPLTAKSKILPEQTLGRGLRRMTPPGLNQAAEIVTVIEHKSFLHLYEDQLIQEGLPISVVDVDKVPRTTVTIYPDEKRDLGRLDIGIPVLSRGYRLEPSLEGLAFEDVKRAFRFKPLPLGQPDQKEIRYEGRHLITDEIVEQMRIKLPLLADPIGAISFFREELERATKIRGAHALIAPLIQQFLEGVLFAEQVTLYDPRLLARLGDIDVREHIRAVFVPLILNRTTKKEQRLKEAPAISVTTWKPYQATHSERHPAEIANSTAFNLVPCNRELEVAMTHFLDRAAGSDVASFAKNAGPQALRIDFLTIEGRRSFYTPDFFVRCNDGSHYLVETKGRADRDVPSKARAAVEWCKAASRPQMSWEYVYVPQGVFERFGGDSFEGLARACAPSLAELMAEVGPQLALSFGDSDAERKNEHIKRFIAPDALDALPSRYRIGIEHAVALFHFHENKSGVSFAPVFQPMLGPIDDAAQTILLGRLASEVPVATDAQRVFFEPDFSTLKNKSKERFLTERARGFRRLLVDRNPIMPTGLLLFALEYAKKTSQPLGGIFGLLRERLQDLIATPLYEELSEVYHFRNTYIAHQKTESELRDVELTRSSLAKWVSTLQSLFAASTPH